MAKQWTPNKFYGSVTRITAKCSLISQERLQVDLSGYCEEAIGIFKTIPTRSYGMCINSFCQHLYKIIDILDPKSRIWSFSIKDYDLLMSKLDALSQKVVVEKLPKFVLNCLKQPKNNVIINFEKLDPVLSSTLLPFQVEGLR